MQLVHGVGLGPIGCVRYGEDEPSVFQNHSGSRSSSATTTPFKTQHFVHPMNTIGPAFESRPVKAANAPKPLPVPAMMPVSAQPGATSFTPSSQTPRLSAHFAKYQLGGNLQQAIASAKQKIDVGADEHELSPDVLDSATPPAPTAGSRTVPGASRAGSLAPSAGVARPPSRKGYCEPAQRHRPSPLAPAAVGYPAVLRQEHGEIPESPQDRSVNLSPHTADSNPGLVSDDEDDDHGSASEDEAPQPSLAHSLGVRRGGCTDHMDLDVAVDDEIDGEHGVVIRRNSMLASEDRGLRTAGSPSRKLDVSGKGA